MGIIIIVIIIKMMIIIIIIVINIFTDAEHAALARRGSVLRRARRREVPEHGALNARCQSFIIAINKNLFILFRCSWRF